MCILLCICTCTWELNWWIIHHICFTLIDTLKEFFRVIAPIHTPLAVWKWKSEKFWVVSDSLWPHRLYSPWNSSGQNTGVVAIPFSRESSQPRDQTQVSHIAGRFFTSWAAREALPPWPSPSSVREFCVLCILIDCWYYHSFSFLLFW